MVLRLTIRIFFCDGMKYCHCSSNEMCTIQIYIYRPVSIFYRFLWLSISWFYNVIANHVRCTLHIYCIVHRKKNKKIKTMISQLCPHVTKCNCALWRISRSMKHQTLKNWTLTIVYRYCLSRHRRCIRNSRIEAHGLLMLVGTFIPEAFMRKYFCDYPTAIP